MKWEPLSPQKTFKHKKKGEVYSATHIGETNGKKFFLLEGNKKKFAVPVSNLKNWEETTA